MVGVVNLSAWDPDEIDRCSPVEDLPSDEGGAGFELRLVRRRVCQGAAKIRVSHSWVGRWTLGPNCNFFLFGLAQ